MIRITCLLLAALVCAHAAMPSAADVSRAMREQTLDPDECYRIRDLNFYKDDLRFYFTDGFLIFAKSIEGAIVSVVFSADVEGGDAEVIVIPPTLSERRSLATFTETPNLDEHFKSAYMLVSDGTGEELLKSARERGRKSREMGLLLAERWDSVARNMSGSFETRIVQDLLSPSRHTGLFFAALGGTKFGNFDVVYDPWNREQVTVGQIVNKGTTPSFDIWASFVGSAVRKGRIKKEANLYETSDIRIEVTLDPTFRISGVTRMKLTPKEPGLRSFAFQVSKQMTIGEVKIDGAPVELYARESLRENALRGDSNYVFLVVSPGPLEKDRTHEIEIKHEGSVVIPAGNDVYYVSSRANWYPRSGADFSQYDLTFRYPKNLTLVATGELVDEKVEGDVKVSHRRASSPIRVAGFNLGDYEKVKMTRAGHNVEVYGNRRVEPALQSKPLPVVVMPPQPRRQTQMIGPLPPPPITATSQTRLNALAEEVSSAFEFMTMQFGPPPLKSLTVAPIPGSFGQGFPGLVYLSTISYLLPEERPAALRGKEAQTFYSDMLASHEVAHQWWGNLVAVGSYADEWLMEGLANYTALIQLEKRRGPRALDQALGIFLAGLQEKMDGGKTIESAGPVTWGMRLRSSQTEGSWRTIIYDKGAWIFHMLRRRMGDEAFFKLLNETCRRYQFKTITSDDFLKLAQELMPKGSPSDALETFFDAWVYGTGIPGLKLSWSVKGKAPAIKLVGTLMQTDVAEDFSVDVPIQIQFAKGTTRTHWVRSSSEPVTFTVNLPQAPSKVAVAAGIDILAVKK